MQGQCNIFKQVLEKEANKPINFEKKSQFALDQVNKIKRTLEYMGSREMTWGEMTQMIKTKEKEEKFLSQLNKTEQKKFQVKKKLFELISPLDEEEKRLDEIISLANVKSLQDIFKLNINKRTSKVMRVIRLKRRNNTGIGDLVDSEGVNKLFGGTVKYNLMNRSSKRSISNQIPSINREMTGNFSKQSQDGIKEKISKFSKYSISSIAEDGNPNNNNNNLRKLKLNTGLLSGNSNKKAELLNYIGNSRDSNNFNQGFSFSRSRNYSVGNMFFNNGTNNMTSNKSMTPLSIINPTNQSKNNNSSPDKLNEVRKEVEKLLHSDFKSGNLNKTKFNSLSTATHTKHTRFFSTFY